MRRKEKEIKRPEEMAEILQRAKYVTIAMCSNGEPYLVTISHGYDTEKNCVYFHCAQEGKKIDILKENNIVWGQALEDHGYVRGSCDHLYATVHFKGSVTFVEDVGEKRHALMVMIKALEMNPEKVTREQINPKSVARVGIGRIDITFMSGKKSDEVIISL
jgi:nitroimidazol reductase NimA-like FMN-containing flavoprotein (pyridoxamine 5'-phosphate oxidase superfamily)